MVIILKTLGFGIWLLIMLVLIAAVRRTPTTQINEVTVALGDQDDAEQVVNQALKKLKKKSV